MKFILESLKIRNFKGIKELDITFNPVETTICGENATGKTTVVDAFNWLLFEKDSKGRSQFEIKTLDENGNPIHGLDHSVEGIFKIDGRTLKLKKVYREVWTKKHGEDQETFTGHERDRFVNDVPVGKTEYDQKINELIDEKIFQLLTDPLYFSQQLHWKERRRALFELAGGEVTTEDVFNHNPKLRHIEADLEDKTIEKFKEALNYQRKQLNKERKEIPVKIKTLHSTIKEVDKTTIDIRYRTAKGAINTIEEEMLDATKADDEQLKKQEQLYKLKSRLKEIEYETKQGIKDPDEGLKVEILEHKNKLRELELEAKGEKRNVETLEGSVERGNKLLNQLREDYTAEANKNIEIDESIKECPTCKRPFSEHEIAEKIEELEANFKANQVQELKRLRDEGQSMAKIVKDYQEELDQANTKYKKLEEEVNTLITTINELEELLGVRKKPELKDLLEMNQEYQDIKSEIDNLEEELRNKQSAVNIDNLKMKKAELELELKELEKDLHQDEINKETLETIEKLMKEEKELSQKISEIEKKEIIADEFISTKAELIEKSINEKFKEVSFRLFKRQVNGVLDETCEVLVDGVPFDNANTAGQVNAGLDIINSLCRHYNMYTPIFIDNRESVNELIDTDSQLINLKVTKHKNLRVEVES